MWTQNIIICLKGITEDIKMWHLHLYFSKTCFNLLSSRVNSNGVQGILYNGYRYWYILPCFEAAIIFL